MFIFRHLFPKRTYLKVTKNVLADHLLPDEIEMITTRFYKYHHQLLRKLPQCESAGVRLMLQLAIKNIALYRALLSHHVKNTEALFYLENIQWEFTRDFAWSIYRLSGLVSRDSQMRLKCIDKFIWKFLFSYPFQRISFFTDEISISFRITRCPVSELFRTIRQTDLCKSAFCNLYYHWADIMGVIFDRSQTLASGAPDCDFKFQINTEK